MDRWIVAGIGTDVGKTVVSALLLHILDADYWKPVECGPVKDSEEIKIWAPDARVHPPAYSFSAPKSPHHAAELEQMSIAHKKIIIPQSNNSLVIEMAGGVMTPLSLTMTNLDLFSQWKAHWILVSRHYLGSLNHTLLAIEAINKINPQSLSLLFNGEPYPEGEEAILALSKVQCLGRLPWLTPKILEKESIKWKMHFSL